MENAKIVACGPISTFLGSLESSGKTREAYLKIWKDKHSFVTSKTATKVEEWSHPLSARSATSHLSISLCVGTMESCDQDLHADPAYV